MGWVLKARCGADATATLANHAAVILGWSDRRHNESTVQTAAFRTDVTATCAGDGVRILIVTDAWEPQVNGVVRTLKSTRRELERLGHEVGLLTPLEFRTLPCPTYPDIRLSLRPGRKVRRRIREFAPQAIHIATEGPLGIAARAYAISQCVPYTTAYHT